MVQKPDADKLVRAVNDGLVNGGIIPDDNHITRLHAHKRRAAPNQPTGAHITITHTDA